MALGGIRHMKIFDYLNLKHPINISTHIYMSQKLKSMKKSEKKKLNQGVNINV